MPLPSEAGHGAWLWAADVTPHLDDGPLGGSDEHARVRGRWVCMLPDLQHADAVWPALVLACRRGRMGPSVKVTSVDALTSGASARVCVIAYTSDCTDEAETERVRVALRSAGITGSMVFTTDPSEATPHTRFVRVVDDGSVTPRMSALAMHAPPLSLGDEASTGGRSSAMHARAGLHASHDRFTPVGVASTLPTVAADVIELDGDADDDAMDMSPQPRAAARARDRLYGTALGASAGTKRRFDEEDDVLVDLLEDAGDAARSAAAHTMHHQHGTVAGQDHERKRARIMPLEATPVVPPSLPPASPAAIRHLLASAARQRTPQRMG